MPEELDQDLIGTVGQVTVPITPTRPGEVDPSGPRWHRGIHGLL